MERFDLINLSSKERKLYDEFERSVPDLGLEFDLELVRCTADDLCQSIDPADDLPLFIKLEFHINKEDALCTLIPFMNYGLKRVTSGEVEDDILAILPEFPCSDYGRFTLDDDRNIIPEG